MAAAAYPGSSRAQRSHTLRTSRPTRTAPSVTVGPERARCFRTLRPSRPTRTAPEPYGGAGARVRRRDPCYQRGRPSRLGPACSPSARQGCRACLAPHRLSRATPPRLPRTVRRTSARGLGSVNATLTLRSPHAVMTRALCIHCSSRLNTTFASNEHRPIGELSVPRQNPHTDLLSALAGLARVEPARKPAHSNPLHSVMIQLTRPSAGPHR